MVKCRAICYLESPHFVKPNLKLLHRSDWKWGDTLAYSINKLTHPCISNVLLFLPGFSLAVKPPFLVKVVVFSLQKILSLWGHSVAVPEVVLFLLLPRLVVMWWCLSLLLCYHAPILSSSTASQPSLFQTKNEYTNLVNYHFPHKYFKDFNGTKKKMKSGFCFSFPVLNIKRNFQTRWVLYSQFVFHNWNTVVQYFVKLFTDNDIIINHNHCIFWVH